MQIINEYKQKMMEVDYQCHLYNKNKNILNITFMRMEI
jgi:hypothetical protein